MSRKLEHQVHLLRSGKNTTPSLTLMEDICKWRSKYEPYKHIQQFLENYVEK